MAEAGVIRLCGFEIGLPIRPNRRVPAARDDGRRSPRHHDRYLFLRSWLEHPLRVAALAPSSARLGDLITSEISPASGPVLELGPGTGVFTRALIRRGLEERDLTLVELDPAFADLLEGRFPHALLLRCSAAKLDCRPGSFGAVVSGLPLLSMSPRSVMAVLGSVFRCARPDAAFYQFTYGPVCPVPRRILDRLGLKAIRIGGTAWNLPPASVYRITRRPPIREAF